LSSITVRNDNGSVKGRHKVSVGRMLLRHR
jgi:hypothetical protein